jgi:hypothetical protein
MSGRKHLGAFSQVQEVFHASSNLLDHASGLPNERRVDFQLEFMLKDTGFRIQSANCGAGLSDGAAIMFISG